MTASSMDEILGPLFRPGRVDRLLRIRDDLQHRTVVVREHARIVHRVLLHELDDVRNDREYRLSHECKAGMTYTEWNRHKFDHILGPAKAVAR